VRGAVSDGCSHTSVLGNRPADWEVRLTAHSSAGCHALADQASALEWRSTYRYATLADTSGASRFVGSWLLGVVWREVLGLARVGSIWSPISATVPTALVEQRGTAGEGGRPLSGLPVLVKFLLSQNSGAVNDQTVTNPSQMYQKSSATASILLGSVRLPHGSQDLAGY
jgi:hypothetical protein